MFFQYKAVTLACILKLFLNFSKFEPQYFDKLYYLKWV